MYERTFASVCESFSVVYMRAYIIFLVVYVFHVGVCGFQYSMSLVECVCERKSTSAGMVN